MNDSNLCNLDYTVRIQKKYKTKKTTLFFSTRRSKCGNVRIRNFSTRVKFQVVIRITFVI